MQSPESGRVVDQIPIASPISSRENHALIAPVGHVKAIPSPMPPRNLPKARTWTDVESTVMRAPADMVAVHMDPARFHPNCDVMMANGTAIRIIPNPKLVIAAALISDRDACKTPVSTPKSGGAEKRTRGPAMLATNAAKRITPAISVSSALFYNHPISVWILIERNWST
jgi:hypothetical protein